MKKCHVGVFISPLKERLAATQESKDTLYWEKELPSRSLKEARLSTWIDTILGAAHLHRNP
jgi:hypothetical protein